MPPQSGQSTSYQPQSADKVYPASPIVPKPVDMRNPLGDGFSSNPDFSLIILSYVYCLVGGMTVGIAATVAHFVMFSVGLGLAILLVGLFIMNLGEFVVDSILYLDTRLLLGIFKDRVPVQLSQWRLNTTTRRAFDSPISMRGYLPNFLEHTFWVITKLVMGVITFAFAIICAVFTGITLGFGFKLLGTIVVEMAASHLAMNMPRYIKATHANNHIYDPEATAMGRDEPVEPYKPPIANDAGVAPPPNYTAATAGGPGIPTSGPSTTTTTTTTTTATDAPAPPKPPIDGDEV